VIEATAYHEAGHMVAAWRMRVKIHKVTIVPVRIMRAASTTKARSGESNLTSTDPSLRPGR
jgi:ATP-dependent Zn protease